MALIRTFGTALTIALLPLAAAAQTTQGRIVGWDDGSNSFLSQIPSGDDFVEVSAGGGEYSFGIGRRADGTVAPWGNTMYHLDAGPNGTVSSASTQYLQVSCGYLHGMALTAGNQVVVWGQSTSRGGCTSNCVLEAPSDMGDYKWDAVSAGENWCLALRHNGTLRVWPTTLMEDWGVYPPPSPDLNHKFVDIAAGAHFGMALQDDGKLFIWGGNYFECNSGGPAAARPAGMYDPIIAIGAGHCSAYAIAPDAYGTYKAWAFGGTMCCGQLNIPSGDITNLISITGAYGHGMGLRTGGGTGNLSVWGGIGGQCPPGGTVSCGFAFGQSSNPYASSSFIAFARGCCNPVGLGIIKVP